MAQRRNSNYTRSPAVSICVSVCVCLYLGVCLAGIYDNTCAMLTSILME